MFFRVAARTGRIRNRVRLSMSAKRMWSLRPAIVVILIALVPSSNADTDIADPPPCGLDQPFTATRTNARALGKWCKALAPEGAFNANAKETCEGHYIGTDEYVTKCEYRRKASTDTEYWCKAEWPPVYHCPPAPPFSPPSIPDPLPPLPAPAPPPMAPLVEVTFNGETYQACLGAPIAVTWNGLFNILEKSNETRWVGCDNESGTLVEPHHWKNTTVTYKEDELAAAPGQRRFFASGPGTLCSGGVPATAKFSVECLA